MARLLSQKYWIGAEISKNSHSIVCSGTNLYDESEVIIKTDSISNKLIEEEYQILLSLPTHPNLVKVIECISCEIQKYLVLQKNGTNNLFQYISRFGKITGEEAYRVLNSICEVVILLHQNFIVHGDIKPENIIIDSKLTPTLCDFGGSFRFTENHPTSNDRLIPKFVSIPYSAPEVTQKEINNGPALDIWSLGVLIYVVLTGRCPWRDDQWKNGRLRYISDSSLSTETNFLLRRILNVKPNNRPSLKDIKCSLEKIFCSIEKSKEIEIKEEVVEGRGRRLSFVGMNRNSRSLTNSPSTRIATSSSSSSNSSSTFRKSINIGHSLSNLKQKISQKL